MKITSSTVLTGLLLLLLIVPGCNKRTGSTANTPPAGKAAGKITTPSPQASPGAPGGLTGTVVETIDAGSYTYVKLATAKGEEWAAVPKAEVKKGQKIGIAGAMLMKDFQSKTLKRKFATIYFGTLAGPGGAMAAPPPHGSMPPGAMPPGHAKGAAAASKGMAHKRLGGKKTALKQPIKKAGHTVAEVYAKRKTLVGKQVQVRGLVVKVNLGIMGRNWIHIQDGSGSESDSDFDLTVTTKGKADKGQVVLIKGILRTDKDFGAGYSYPVILEDGVVEK